MIIDKYLATTHAEFDISGGWENLPTPWPTPLLRQCLISIKDGTHGSFTRVDTGVPLLSAKNVADGRVKVGAAESMISEDDYVEIHRSGYLRKGDLLLTIVGTIGRAAVFNGPEPVAFQRSVASLRFAPFCSTHFFYYLTQSGPFQAQLTARTKQSAQGGVYLADVAALRVPVPPLPEQRAIAAFLDRETARIDELVAKKRKLVDRLNERRHAAIYRWVSGGHMLGARKEISLPWLSAVPAHWEVAPLYSRYSVQLGKMLDAARISGKHLAPYLRNVNIQWDRLDLNDLLEMDFDAEDRVKYALRAGDLLVCEGGEVGRAAIWPGEPAGCYYQKALHRLRPTRPGEDSRFLLYVLWAAASMGVFVAEGNPNTFDHLTAEKLRCHRFPFPPSNEQRAIVTELDTRLQTISRLEDTTKRQIYVLLERRQALVTAAVTGKIGVA